MINMRQKLTIIGEEPMNWMVRDENGNEGQLTVEHLTNYVRVDNTLIPKSDVEWF